jgi:hypothetical protein
VVTLAFESPAYIRLPTALERAEDTADNGIDHIVGAGEKTN